MWKSIALASFCLVAAQLRAEPELKGSPAELTAYLTGIPQLVSVTGESELKVPARPRAHLLESGDRKQVVAGRIARQSGNSREDSSHACRPRSPGGAREALEVSLDAQIWNVPGESQELQG